MASAATIVGVLLIVGLIGIGVTQAVLEQLPGAGIAGAATEEPRSPTQQELNLCVNDCMGACVAAPGDEKPCLAGCEESCGI